MVGNKNYCKLLMTVSSFHYFLLWDEYSSISHGLEKVFTCKAGSNDHETAIPEGPSSGVKSRDRGFCACLFLISVYHISSNCENTELVVCLGVLNSAWIYTAPRLLTCLVLALLPPAALIEELRRRCGSGHGEGNLHSTSKSCCHVKLLPLGNSSVASQELAGGK